MVLPEAGCIACNACQSCAVPGSGCGLLGVARKAILTPGSVAAGEERNGPPPGRGGQCGGGPRPWRRRERSVGLSEQRLARGPVARRGIVAPPGSVGL